MANTAGTLEIDIKAGIARLSQDMREAKNVVKESMESVNKSVELAKHGLELLGLAWGVDQIKEWLHSNAEAVDANAKMADRLGITTEAMAGLTLQAQLSNVSIETVSTGMRTMLKTVYDANNGVQLSAQAFEQLHLSASQLAQLAPDQQLQKILAALSGVNNITERNALAMQVFGGRAAEMLNLVADGADGIKSATEDAKAWGVALDRIDSAKIEMANDAMTRAHTAMQGVANTINVALAPIIKALADDFSNAAKDAHGFRDEIMDGMEKVATVVAYTANVIRGLEVAWKVVEVAAAEVFNAQIQIVNGFVQVIQDAYNKLADSYIGKKMGLPVATFGDTIKDVADTSSLRVKELEDELQKLAMQKMPAEGIQAWFKKVREEADKAAKEIADKSKSMSAGGAPIDPSLDKAHEAYLKQLDGQLAAIRKSTESQNEVETEAYAQRLNILNQGHVAGLLSDEAYAQERQQIEIQHQAAMGDISAQGLLQRQKFEQMTTTQQTQFVLGQLLSLTSGVATHNKTMFEINKIAGIANAIINTSLGVTKALSSYPPPLSFAMAAAQFAAGMVQVQQIKSASFSSSTSAPSVGGGGAIPVTQAASYVSPQQDQQQQQQPQSAVQVIIQGNLMTNDFVEQQVIPTIQDAVNGRDVVLFQSNSRQALELSPA